MMSFPFISKIKWPVFKSKMIFYIGFIFIIKFIGIKLIGVIMIFFVTQLNNINIFKSKRLRGVFFLFSNNK